MFDWNFRYNVSDDLLLSHPAMHVQEGHKQLGQIAAIYSGAVHTRFDHSGLVTYIIDDICDVLMRKERLPAARSDIRQFAKLHDCGHPPFSHAVEYVLKAFTGKTHNDRALEVLDSDVRDTKGRTIQDVLTISNADVEVIRAMLEKKDRARSICTDKTLGGDKLAYTWMDAVKCEFYQMPPNHKRIIPFLNFYANCGLCVDLHHRDIPLLNPINFVRAVQEFYFMMYTEVYLSNQSLAYERHIQKSVEHAIRAGVVKADDVWDLPDDVLLRMIEQSKRKDEFTVLAKKYLEPFTSKKPYAPVIAFKYVEHANDYVAGEEVFEIARDFKDAFVRHFENPLHLTELEAILSDEFSVPILCCLLPDSDKIRPQDVHFFDNGRCKTTLFQERPHHYRQLLETADAFFAIRLLVPPEERDAAKRRAKDIADFFREAVAKMYAGRRS